MTMAGFHGTVDERIIQDLIPIIERSIDTVVETSLNKSVKWRVVPGTIQAVSGPYADVEPDDSPGEYVQAIRLDDFQGVTGGIFGSRARVLLLRIPPAGLYCLGAIPDPRPEEEADSEGLFWSEANDSARSPGAATDMTVTADLVGGYIYRLDLHTTFSVADTTFPNAYALELDQDGTIVGRFWRQSNVPAEMTGDHACLVRVRDDIEASVFTVEVSAGSTAAMTMTAQAIRPRSLMCTCVGPARGFV